jgi:mRNA interferase MazF
LPGAVIRAGFLSTSTQRTAKTAGLRLDSVIMMDNLATVLDSEIDCVLGHFPKMEAMDAALKHTLDLH